MIKAYLKSPEWYKRCYVDKTHVRVPTPSLKIGSIVDAHLSGEECRYQVSVLKRDNPVLFEAQKSMPDDIFVTQTEMDKAVAMYKAVERCDFWKVPMGERRLQVILEGNIDGTLVCGKPDVLEWDAEGNLWIIDIKTAQPANVKSIFAWDRTCQEYGYYVQLAMYARLCLQNGLVDKFSKIRFRFITPTCDRDLVATVQLFKVDWRIIDAAMPVIERALADIRAGRFDDPMPTWGEALTISGQSPSLESMDDWDNSEDQQNV